MCNTRAFKHSCGHVTSHLVSTCRGTYASPNNSERKLCHAPPTLVLAVPERCRTCQWVSFSRLWDSRISEAHQKLSFATSAQMNLQDDWMDDEISTTIDANDFGECTRASERLDAAREEADRARIQVDYLVSQYEREKRQRWRPTRPSLATPPQKSKSRSQRAPPLTRKGSSPLKKTQSIDDVTFQRVAPEPESDDDSETESRRESFGSTSSGGLTDDTSDNDDDSPPSTPPESPPFNRKSFSFDNIGSTWSKSTGDAPTKVVSDEDDEEMLPNFGFA